MNELSTLMLVAAISVPTAAVAHDTETAFPSRGACEAASAAMSDAEKDWLLEIGMDYFDTRGDVSAMVRRSVSRGAHG